MTTSDPIVNSVVDQYKTRSEQGMQKYGMTMMDNPISLVEWLEHLKQELMDATLYAERAKQKVTEANYSFSSSYVEKLKEFHEAVSKKVNSPYLKQEFVPSSEVALLRAALIKEEAEELIHALEEEDLHQVRKEIADLLYVTFGTAEVFCIPTDDDFALVHENNMLKVRNASFRDDGKLVKSPDHPKVKFPSISNDG